MGSAQSSDLVERIWVFHAGKIADRVPGVGALNGAAQDFSRAGLRQRRDDVHLTGFERLAQVLDKVRDQIRSRDGRRGDCKTDERLTFE